MVEAGVPTIAFTITFLLTKDLTPALVLSVATALVLLVLRLVQGGSVKFVVNSLFGIGLGALFAWRSIRGGGDGNDAALAYFLPGIIYNAGYAGMLLVSIVTRWPFVGFLVGSVTGDPTAWRQDPRVVRLCSNLTWLLLLPCLVRVSVQLPLYLAGKESITDPNAIVAALGISKIVLGWPLQIAALAAMVWLLARDHTPVEEPA